VGHPSFVSTHSTGHGIATPVAEWQR